MAPAPFFHPGTISALISQPRRLVPFWDAVLGDSTVSTCAFCSVAFPLLSPCSADSDSTSDAPASLLESWHSLFACIEIHCVGDGSGLI